MSVGQTLGDLVLSKTGGRPYAFVIMKYDSKWPLYERIKQIANDRFDLACIRADDLKSSGHDLRAKIHMLIDRAEIVIAEVSFDSANVFYEVGYAVAMGKDPLLLADRKREVPVDLQGLEVIRYQAEDREGMLLLEHELAGHLKDRMNQDLALVRDMLEAPERYPAYIVSSPKYPGKDSRILAQVFDTRTYGDHLGILGLIAAFGSAWGDSKGVELISALHSPPGLVDQPINLYLVGSGKVNPHTAKILSVLQAGAEVQWSIDPAPGFEISDGDWPAALYRVSDGSREPLETVLKEISAEGYGNSVPKIVAEDYGIIVRGPHPKHRSERIVLIMAGPHSLGTGAACVAATRPEYIRQISDRLPNGVLADKRRGFWALVKGVVQESDNLLDTNAITVEDCGELPAIGKRNQ